MLNIANHQGNANQNHSEISPSTFQNGFHRKVYFVEKNSVEKTEP